ncbi:MAG: hypothetical protein ACJ76S_02130 [Solirubrobacteraceae bacterium]|jgi:hypothetical protein
MTRDQLVERAAAAAYDAFRIGEVQRRLEQGPGNQPGRRRKCRLPGWHGLEPSQQRPWLERARPIVDALERDGVLASRDQRRYRVVIDHPDMARRYEYDEVPAFSAYAACVEGARRAIRDDPNGGYPPGISRRAKDDVAIEDPAMAQGVAMYGQAWRTDEPGIERETYLGPGEPPVRERANRALVPA